MYFRAKWPDESEIDSMLNDYDDGCVSRGGVLDAVDGLCSFPMTVEDNQLFDSDQDVISVANVLAKATIGAFPPTMGGETVAGVPDVEKFPPGPLTSSTIFKFTDMFGVTQYRKNSKSTVVLGNGSLQFENPVSFFSISEPTVRDAEYELDATLQQYFYHENLAPFLATRMSQRFGNSNPSPRHVEVAATAFHTGTYEKDGFIFGSGKYGSMESLVAAILLDEEMLDPALDADPASGSISEPYLRLVRLMRSLDYKPNDRFPYPKFDTNLQEVIGQEPHRLPSVFSYFRPEFSAAGKIISSGLVSPEAQGMSFCIE
jgi:Protein of unknown function (DUF1800)